MTGADVSGDMRAWFERYLGAFNRSDFETLGAYYAHDIAFHGQAAQLRGREAVVDFYRMVKGRLDETIELLSFVGVPGRIAAELRTTLVARESWPDFPTGPLKAGEMRQAVSFVFYDIAEGRFARIRSARFSASEAKPMTEDERLARYMDAFNRRDYAALCDFYCPDIRLVTGSGKELVGRQAISDFYREVNSSTQRTISILQSFCDGQTVAAELESEFLALEHLPDFTSGPMAKGDRLYINSFAFYDLRGGRYARIRAATFRRVWRRIDPDGAVSK